MVAMWATHGDYGMRDEVYNDSNEKEFEGAIEEGRTK
jgi:hypothetical protein